MMKFKSTQVDHTLIRPNNNINTNEETKIKMIISGIK